MSEEFLEQLICLLTDDNEDIVRHALKDIEKHDGSSTASALESALDYIEEGVLPELVSIIMGRAESLGPDSGKECFLTMIGHHRSAVRHHLILGAGSKYIENDSSKLLHLLKEESSPAVLASLITLVEKDCSSEEICLQIEKLVAHIDSRVRANAVEALDRLSIRPDEKIVEPLLQDSSPRVKANAIKLCWPYEPERMEKIVLGELKSLDVKRQRCALYLLGVLSPIDDVATILAAELSDDNPDCRALAAKGLSKLAGPLDYEPIAQACLRETESSIIKELELILCKAAENGNCTAILDYLFSVVDASTDINLRISAAELLSRIGGTHSLPYIQRCIKLQIEELSVAAIFGLSQVESPLVIDILKELADHSKGLLSARALLELCFAGEIPPMERLMELVSSKDLRVLSCGALALARYGTLDTLSILVEAYRRITAQVIITDEESEIKSELLAAIESIRSREER